MTTDRYFSISMLDVKGERISTARIVSGRWMTGDRHDGHPDPLVMSPAYAATPPGWFSLSAYWHAVHYSPGRPLSTSLRLWLSVVTAGVEEYRDPHLSYAHP